MRRFGQVMIGVLAFSSFVGLGGRAAADQPAADEPAEAAMPGAYTWKLALEGRAFPGTRELCAAFVAEAKAAAVAAADSLEEQRTRPPRCSADATVVPLGTTGTFRSARAFDLDDGLVSRRQLAVTTPAGTLLTWVSWNIDDPRDPGCPSIIRATSVESLRVENGSLVVSMLGERTTYVETSRAEDPGYRAELVRTAFWFVPEGTTVRPWMWADTLGSKVQPVADHRVPWEQLRWTGPQTLRVDRRGVGSVGG